jgi:hypothetical protein
VGAKGLKETLMATTSEVTARARRQRSTGAGTRTELAAGGNPRGRTTPGLAGVFVSQ